MPIPTTRVMARAIGHSQQINSVSPSVQDVPLSQHVGQTQGGISSDQPG